MTAWIDFVSIVTPNNLHFPIAKEFLEAGFNVICDKPMTFDLEEALALRDIVKRTGKVFVLTHNYIGYPMVKEARELVGEQSWAARWNLAAGDTNIFAGPAEQHNVALAIEQGSMIP